MPFECAEDAYDMCLKCKKVDGCPHTMIFNSPEKEQIAG